MNNFILLKYKWFNYPIFIAFTIISIQIEAIGQLIPSDLNYLNYTTTNGLPSIETYDVFQDSRGGIWIGTDNGVVQFDGVHFTKYTTNDGLTDNTVFKIYEDAIGRIWFGTFNRKLCYFKDGKFTNYPFNNQIERNLSSVVKGKTITEIEYLEEQNLLKLSLANGSKEPIPELIVDSTGIVSSELKQLEIDITKVAFTRTRNKKELFQVISNLPSIKNEPTGFNRMYHTLNHGKVRIIKSDSIDLYCTSKGLFWYSPKEDSIVRNEFSNFHITGAQVDFEGGLWCSTLHNGLLYTPTPQLKAYSIDKIGHGKIQTVLKLGNKIAFCYNGGVGNFSLTQDNRFLQSLSTPISSEELNNERITRGIKFENPMVLANTNYQINSILKINDSLSICSSPSQKIILLSIQDHPVKTLPPNKLIQTQDIYGAYWTFSDSGKFRSASTPRADGKFNTIKMLNLNFPKKLVKLIPYSNSTLLAITLEGVFLFDLNQKDFKEYDNEALQNKRIQDVIQLPDSTLIFATKTNGLFIKQGNKTTNKILSQKNVSASINQLTYDSTRNIIFAGTNQGIYRIKQSNTSWESELVLSKYDGLELTEIRQLVIQNNQLFFSSDKNVGAIHLDHIYKFLPSPKQSEFNSINNTQYTRDEIIAIPFDSGNFEINFQAISYKSQGDLSYFYKLNDNENWNYTTNTSVNFDLSRPGNHTISWKSANIYGIESPVRIVKLKISTPYWLTWWFISLAVLAIMALFGLIIYRTITFYKNQTAIQRKLNELQVLSLQSKMSPHFIFNSLNSIQNYILTNNKMAANEYLIEFSRLIRTILKNSENSTILLSKELEILNLYVELEKKRLRKPFSYKIEFKGDINHSRCVIPSLLIQPYVENSIWHGQVYNNPEGEIKIIIEQKMKSLFITISDNGIGMKKAAELKKLNNPEHTSIGTKTTKNRIELISELNAQMSEVIISETYSNSPNREFVGTTIKFSIPYILNSPDI